MAVTMKTVTSFYDEEGNLITESERTAMVPGIEEIDRDGFRAAFHELEVTVLDITDDTRETALSGLLKEYSKKTKSVAKGEGILVEKTYTIQCEMGFLRITGHKLMNGKKALYDSTVSFFEETTPKEAFKSNLARELMLHLASIASVRNATNMFNRIRRVKEGKMIETTFRNCVEREGLAIQQCMEKQAEEALEEQGLAIDDAKRCIKPLKVLIYRRIRTILVIMS